MGWIVISEVIWSPNPSWGILVAQAGKESACSSGDPCLIPGSGRSPGKRNGYPLQHSSLENSMDCIVHGVAHDWATFTFNPSTSECDHIWMSQVTLVTGLVDIYINSTCVCISVYINIRRWEETQIHRKIPVWGHRQGIEGWPISQKHQGLQLSPEAKTGIEQTDCPSEHSEGGNPGDILIFDLGFRL